MSPFARYLYELRMQRGIRQADLARLLGYEQSYVSALEVGIKGPPPVEFLSRLSKQLSLSNDEQHDLAQVVDASQRKILIDPDTSEDVFWMLKDLRDQIDSLTPTQVRMVRDVLRVRLEGEEARREPVRRLKRRQHGNEETTM